jgi:hypothetical protein
LRPKTDTTLTVGAANTPSTAAPIAKKVPKGMIGRVLSRNATALLKKLG